MSFGRDESGRTANRGAGGPVTALIGANVGPSRRRLGVRAATAEDPAVVGVHDHQVFGVTLESEPRLLDQAEPASQERQVPTVRLRLVEVDRQGPGLLCRGPSRAAGLVHRMAMGPSRRRVDQLDVRGVLRVPVQLDGRPVGGWMSMAPAAAWSGGVDGARSVRHPRRRAGPYGRAELVSRDLAMAQLRQVLTSRIWIEQAEGVLAASQEVTPDERFQPLRALARSSSRRLADLVREVVVQEAQRERVAALAMDDARGRVAEARARAADQRPRTAGQDD